MRLPGHVYIKQHCALLKPLKADQYESQERANLNSPSCYSFQRKKEEISKPLAEVIEKGTNYKILTALHIIGNNHCVIFGDRNFLK